MTCYNRAETTFRFLRSLFAKGVGRLQPEVAVLAALLGGVLVQSLLFFARIPCTPYPMWDSFGAVGLLLVVCDWRVFLRFVVLTAAMLSLGIGLILDSVKKQSDQAFNLRLLTLNGCAD